MVTNAADIPEILRQSGKHNHDQEQAQIEYEDRKRSYINTEELLLRCSWAKPLMRGGSRLLLRGSRRSSMYRKRTKKYLQS